METNDRLVRIDPDDKYDPSKIPESALEETLKVLRTMRECVVETNDHEADIILGRAYVLIGRFAQYHNELLNAKRQQNDSDQQSQTGSEAPQSPAEGPPS